MLQDILAGPLGSDKPPWDDFWYETIGRPTHAGVDVSPETAMRFSTVLACIRKISQTVASLPVRVYEKTGPGVKQAVDHPLNDVLDWKGNMRSTGVTVRSSMSANRLGWGNGVAEITYTNDQQVAGLTPLMSRDLRPKISDRGELLWEHWPQGRYDTTLPPGKYLHDPGPFVLDGVLGVTPIAAKETIGGAIAAQTFTNAYFGNGASPGGFLEFPAEINLDEERQTALVEQFNEMWRGADKAHKVGRLREGVKFNQIGMKLDEMQLVALRQYTDIQICTLYDVPPPLIQILDPGKYTAIEQSMISWARDSLLPICKASETAYKRQFFPDSKLYVKHNLAGLARGDMKARGEFYGKGIANGWFTVNDVREMEELNPVDGGDTNWIQMNMMPLDSGGQVVPGVQNRIPPPQDGDEEDEEATRQPQVIVVNSPPQSTAVFLPLFADAAARVTQRERKAIASAEKRLGDNRDAFAEWCVSYFDGHEEYTRKQLEPVVCSLEQVAGKPASERPADFAKRYAEHQRSAAYEVVANNGTLDTDYLLSELKTTYLTEDTPCLAN